MSATEYNAAKVWAASSKTGTRVLFGYELLQRTGRSRWQVVGKTESHDEAQAWASRSGYKVPR